MTLTSHRKTLVDYTLNDGFLLALFFTGLFACAPVITLFGNSLYKLFALISVVFLLLMGRLLIGKTGIQMYAAFAIVTTLLTIVQLPDAYIAVEIKGLMSILLIAMIVPMLYGDASSYLLKGVILGGKLNIIWIFIQMFAWWFLSVDINDLLFSQVFNMVETASQFKATGFVATGLCWNVGGIVAALLSVFIAEREPVWKILTFVAGVLTQSSTALLGLGLCTVYIFVKWLFSNSDLIRSCVSGKWFLCIAGFLSVFALIYSISPTVQHALQNALSFTVFRIGALNGQNVFDSSAQAHSDYISNIPALFSNMNFKSFLFGYGINCSGLPYSALTGQYKTISAWTVECDLTNTLLSMGVIGTGVFYGWLFSSVVTTWRINKSISFLLIVLIFCGFFYNLQSVNSFWLILCEASIVSDAQGEQCSLFSKNRTLR